MFKAAIELIAEQGINKVTLRAIGERSGYSRGLLNYRFGMKDGLIAELVKHCNRLWGDELNRSGLSSLMAALDANKYFLQSSTSEVLTLYVLWFESIGEESVLRDSLSRMHNIYRRDLSKWVREGINAGEIKQEVDPDLFAQLYCSFLFGSLYQWILSPDVIETDRLVEEYRKNMLIVLKK